MIHTPGKTRTFPRLLVVTRVTSLSQALGCDTRHKPTGTRRGLLSINRHLVSTCSRVRKDSVESEHGRSPLTAPTIRPHNLGRKRSLNSWHVSKSVHLRYCCNCVITAHTAQAPLVREGEKQAKLNTKCTFTTFACRRTRQPSVSSTQQRSLSLRASPNVTLHLVFPHQLFSFFKIPT